MDELFPKEKRTRQRELAALIKKLPATNEAARRRSKERLAKTELAKFAQLLEIDVMKEMCHKKRDLRSMQLSNARKQKKLKHTYLDAMFKKTEDYSILARVVKKVKEFHHYMKDLRRKIKDKVSSSVNTVKDHFANRHGSIHSSQPQQQPDAAPIQPPAPIPSAAPIPLPTTNPFPYTHPRLQPP